jgi:hypothetical protein
MLRVKWAVQKKGFSFILFTTKPSYSYTANTRENGLPKEAGGCRQDLITSANLPFLHLLHNGNNTINLTLLPHT